MPVFAEALGTAFRIDATKDKSVILTPGATPSTPVETPVMAPPPMVSAESGVSPALVIGALAVVGVLVYVSRGSSGPVPQEG